MPSIVRKTVYEKAFISKEAKNSVTKALDCCIYDQTINAIVDFGCNGNKPALIEGSYTYCNLFVKNAPNGYFKRALSKDEN